jgi:hypothetical protein
VARGKKTARGAAPGAPRPKIEPRKPHLFRRTWFRRTFLIVLGVVVLWVGLFTWGHVSRASVLRSYDRKLFDAARPFFQHIETSPTSMEQVVADYTNGTVSASQLGKDAAVWETDYTAAHAAVSALKPPRELKDAQQTFISALEEYIATVRFYVVVQKQQELENAIPVKNKKLRQQADDQRKLLLDHVAATSARGDTMYTQAIAAIKSLAKSWGVKAPSFPSAPGQIPPPTGALPTGISP